MTEQSTQPIDGRLERDGDRWRVRFTRALPHSPEKVWRAITEPEHLAAWFPHRIVGERAPGATLRFEEPDDPDEAFEGTMLTFDPPRVMEFTWGTDTVRIELRAAGDATELTLIDTLEQLGTAARNAAGWQECLDDLGFHLAGTPSPWPTGGRWKEANPVYVERFGPDASSIGPPAGHPVLED